MPHQLGYNLVPKIGIPTSIQVNIMNTQCNITMNILSVLNIAKNVFKNMV